MLIGRSKERLRVTNSIAFLRFRYQICYHFGRPKVAQYIYFLILYCETKLVRNPLLFAVFVLVSPCTKSRKRRVKRVYTKITIYSLPCMSYILPFLLPPSPCPLVPPPPLDLTPLFYVDGLQTSSMVASAKIADNGRKWEDTTSYSDIIIRLYLWIALFPTSYGPARHISVWY